MITRHWLVELQVLMNRGLIYAWPPHEGCEACQGVMPWTPKSSYTHRRHITNTNLWNHWSPFLFYICIKVGGYPGDEYPTYSKMHLIYLPPPPVDRMMDRCLWKYYLPATSLTGGKNRQVGILLTLSLIGLSGSGVCLFSWNFRNFHLNVHLLGIWAPEKWSLNRQSQCKGRKTTKHKLHKIWRSLKFWKNSGKQTHSRAMKKFSEKASHLNTEAFTGRILKCL